MKPRHVCLLLLCSVFFMMFSCKRGGGCSEEPEYRKLNRAFDSIGVLYSTGNAKEMCSMLDSIKPLLSGFDDGDTCQQRLWLRYLHSRMVYFAQFTPHTDSMIYYGVASKNFSRTINDGKSMVLSSSNLADAYRQAGDLSKAISEYDDAIRLNDSIQADSALYLPMYSGMACSFNVLHNEQETEKWLGRILAMSRYMTTIDSISYFTMKGNCLYFARKYKKSLEVFMQYDSLLQHHPDLKLDRIICDVDIADNVVHMMGSKVVPASRFQVPRGFKVQEVLEEAVGKLEEAGITSYTPYIHTLMIQNLMNERKDKEALQLAKATMGEIHMMNPDHRVARYDVLASCFEANNRNEDAHEYAALYHNLNDSLRSIQTIALTNEIENRYAHDSQVKEQEIELQHRDIHELHLYVALLLLAIAVLTLGFAYYINRRNAKRKQLSSLNRIIQLRGQIIRNRLTPHFISNALSLGHNLSKDDIDNLIHLIREALSTSDNLSCSLASELALANSYISVASIMYDGKITATTHIDTDICLSEIQIPTMSLLSIVENAIKHGKADEDKTLGISISVTRDDNTFSIEVVNAGHLSDYCKSNDSAWHGLQMISQVVDIMNSQQKRRITFDINNTEDGGHVCAMLRIQ